ncbi:hypothetical protein N9166_01975, partial [bacterium]|nr:hypothetical protein [bacterium]
LTVANERVDFTLDDQREVAAAVRDLTEGRALLFLNRSEILFLMRRVNPLPNIYWNDAVWSHVRLSEAESSLEAAERLVRSVDPDVLAWHWRIGRSHLVEGYPERRIQSSSGRYAVTLRVR